MARWTRPALIILLALIGIALLLAVSSTKEVQRTALGPTTPAPTAPFTPEPIQPTRTPTPAGDMATATAVPPTRTPPPTSTSPTTAVTTAGETAGPTTPFNLSPHARFGVTGNLSQGILLHEAGLPFDALLNWSVALELPPLDFNFWQMIRTSEEGIRETSWEEIAEAVAANPGSVWLVGNEPDVRWQDNVTPQRYATIYHEVYTFIKERDPEAQVAIGGVSQPTPLRIAYLDIVLDTYEARYGRPMPIDIWNVHAFTLREEAGSWGVDIPPGMDGRAGRLYELEDHANIEIIRQNLIDFRAWMAARGYRDRPLVISEYGILMPTDYGFPPDLVARFMTGTFDLFQSLANDTGYPADDNRLIQWWFWFSLYDEVYATGNLYDPQSRQLTPLGRTWVNYGTEP